MQFPSSIDQIGDSTHALSIHDVPHTPETLHVINQHIQQLEALITAITNLIPTLEKIRSELKGHLTRVKVAKSLGTTASIVGSVLLFTPLFPIGIGVLAAGTGTAIGSTIAGKLIDRSYTQDFEKAYREVEQLSIAFWSQITMSVYDRIDDDVINTNKDAEGNHQIVKTIGTITKGHSVGSILRLAQVLPQLSKVISSLSLNTATPVVSFLQATGNVAGVGMNVAKSAMVVADTTTAGASVANAARGGVVIGGIIASRVAIALAGVGIVFGVADIVLTWALNDTTLTTIKDIIKLFKSHHQDYQLLHQQIVNLRDQLMQLI